MRIELECNWIDRTISSSSLLELKLGNLNSAVLTYPIKLPRKLYLSPFLQPPNSPTHPSRRIYNRGSSHAFCLIISIANMGGLWCVRLQGSAKSLPAAEAASYWNRRRADRWGDWLFSSKQLYSSVNCALVEHNKPANVGMPALPCNIVAQAHRDGGAFHWNELFCIRSINGHE